MLHGELQKISYHNVKTDLHYQVKHGLFKISY